jgi:glycosyltransferase involved in cell wall biosynthesis
MGCARWPLAALLLFLLATVLEGVYVKRRSVFILWHNLKRQGAQLAMSEVAISLLKQDQFRVQARAFGGGGIRKLLESHGANVEVSGELSIWRRELETADVVFVNSIMLHQEILEIRKMRLTAPLIWCIHESNTKFLFEQMPTLAASAPVALRAADSVVFVSDAQMSEYKEILKEHDGGGDHGRFVRVYNGVDVAAVASYREKGDRASVRAALGLGVGTTVFITVGTPKRWKGQAGILAPLAAMVQREYDVHLLVVGASNKGSAYEKEIGILAAELGVQDRITLVKRGEQQHVFKHLLAADVYVCNSLTDSSPLGMIEAMSFELPVVSAAVNGIVEQVDDGSTGFLFPTVRVCGGGTVEAGGGNAAASVAGGAAQGSTASPQGSCGDGDAQWVSATLGEAMLNVLRMDRAARSAMGAAGAAKVRAEFSREQMAAKFHALVDVQMGDFALDLM